jgi:hypothetical protein
MIQDGSIGRGVRFTARLVVSIRLRGITNLKRIRSKSDDCSTGCGEFSRQTRGNLLKVPYGHRFNPRKTVPAFQPPAVDDAYRALESNDAAGKIIIDIRE